ncbi:MAG TPA: choice-of-anchor D domain-containing protein [Terriglobia bacterium]|nr:choice-of-anchor D domain-containing protein [Terriglobia bacterium]
MVTLTGRGVSAAIVTFSPTSLTFAGNQVVGTSSASQTVTLTNTGAGPLVITSIATSSADFTQTNNCPPSLAVSATCTITVTFTPTTSVGGISGSLIVTDDAAGSPHQVSLFGTSIAPQISLSTSFLNFDPRAVGTASTPQTVTVTNFGQAPMHITSIVASSDAAETSACPISPAATLAPNATCTISITFTPAAVGSNTGTVTINSDAFQSPATVINLSGTGFVARLVPRTLSFVAQPLGTTSAIQTAVFLNTGAMALSITSITISGTAFALAGNTCGTSLAGGASCIINITFTPTAVGISGGFLTVVSSAPDGPLSMNLQGTGVTLTFSPQSLGPLVGMLFDNQGVGTTSAAQTTTMTNTAATAVSITGITTSAPFAETNTCGTSLAAGASCTISAMFSPISAGGQSGSVSIASGAPEGTLNFPLYGVGDGLQQSTRILFFGPVAVGSTSAAQTVTLTNTGASAVTVTTIAATGDFAQTNTCGASIAPSANCTVSVTFTPSASGARSSNLSITTSASGAPQLVALFGNTNILNLPGFMTNVFGPNDDASTPMVPLPFPVNFFGNQYNGLFVNNNGNVTFDQTLGTFTPFDLTSTGQVIIAPFFADVYTATWPISGLVTFGADTVNGHAAFGINYFRVNYYAASDKMNTFQLILINRSDRAPGDFDVEFNYGNIAWETGSASGGTDGLGGSSARAGFSNGTGQPNTFFELPGSAINGGLLDTNTQTGLIHNSLNSPIPGVYIFNVHAGAVVPPGFALSTTSLTFPTTPVNQSSSSMPVTVSNTGGSSFAITNIATSAGFSQTNNCPATLGPGGTCTVNVVFTPTATGAQTGTLTFTDGAPGSPQTVSLSGTGGSTAQLTLSATSLALPDTHVNQTCTPGTVTLTNSGTGTLTISNISISGPYTQTNTCPASLAAGASCAVSVTFTPTVVGNAEAGTLTITSNVSSSPNSVALTGNATPACLLLPAVQTVTLLRGTDSTTFSLTHQTQGGDAETPIQLTCTNQAPATCAFNPDAIGAMGVTTLTLSNLKAITADTLLFQTHGDATLDHHTTGLSVLFSDFLIASAPITGTITAGQTASYTMAIEPQNGLQGTVSFNCTGAPTGATCAVTPAAVTLSGTGTQNVTVSVTTTARSFAAPRNTWRVLPPGSRQIGLTLLALLALLAGLAFCSAGVSPADRGSESRATTGASNRLRLATMGLGVMLAVVLTWAACGGGGSMAPMSQNALATPAGTYNLTVTGTYSAAGTSTQIVHNTTVTLTVH